MRYIIKRMENPGIGRWKPAIEDMQTNVSNGIESLSFKVSITPKIQKDGEWYVAFCPEVPEANGQGRTPEESVKSLEEGVESVLQDRRADAATRRPRGAGVSEPA